LDQVATLHRNLIECDAGIIEAAPAMHNEAMNPGERDNTVAIAGGGIAGMASALSLARVGWRVQVYERATQFAEVGAGVQLGPNVTRILREWGLASGLSASACAPEALLARSALTGEVMARLDLRHASARYGAPYVTLHRADLHTLLDRAAREAGAEVTLHTPVQTIHDEGLAMRLTGGTNESSPWELRSALAVVADGVWSQLAPQVMPDLPAPRWSGHVAYRALLSMADVPKPLRTQEVTVWMAPHVHLVCYPVSAGERLNVVCLLEPETSASSMDLDWNQQRDASQMQADLQMALRSACPDLHALVDACNGWRYWPLYARRPMRGAHEQGRGRMALLGDAAHPMLPYLAQGAGMAIEDAKVLADALSESDDVVQAVAMFAHRRWARNARVQQRAMRNGDIFHAQGWLRWARDQGLRWMGPTLMDVPWLYGWRG
jgi:salicylate hydroxylase